MRARFWALTVAMLALAVLATGLASCTAGGVARGPANTPVPTKTLRPTFTATVEKPTLIPSPTAGQTGEQSGSQPAAPAEGNNATAVPPTATQPPPTAEPSPTPAPAAFTVTSASLNVRSGPSTAFPVIGRLTQGQSFPISGANEDSTWWQFDYNGKTGWVAGTNVTATATETVQVAENIPQPPTAAPRPTARPAAPTQPPAAPVAATKYGVSGTGFQPNTNNYVTVYCILYNQAGTGLLPGKLRVSRDGQVVGTAEFSSKATYYLSSGYNAGCKVETSPAVDGTYTAVLVEGDQVVSDPITFTVNGTGNRIWFTAWKAK